MTTRPKLLPFWQENINLGVMEHCADWRKAFNLLLKQVNIFSYTWGDDYGFRPE